MSSLQTKAWSFKMASNSSEFTQLGSTLGSFPTHLPRTMCHQLPCPHTLSLSPSQLVGSFLSALKLTNFQRKCPLNLIPRPPALKLLPYIHSRKNTFTFTTFTSSPSSNSFQPGFCPRHSSETDLKPCISQDTPGQQNQ